MKLWRLLAGLGVILCLTLFFAACGDDNPVDSNGDSNQVQPLKAGNWTSTTDFGEFDFIVKSGGEEITELKYIFSGWTCGPVTISGTITSTRTPGWPITDRTFTIERDLDIHGNETMTIQGTFSDNGEEVTGTFSAVMYGSTCQGTLCGACAD